MIEYRAVYLGERCVYVGGYLCQVQFDVEASQVSEICSYPEGKGQFQLYSDSDDQRLSSSTREIVTYVWAQFLGAAR
jgi:hypothetical protein